MTTQDAAHQSDAAWARGGEPLLRRCCARRGGLAIAAALLCVGMLFAAQALRLPLGTVGMPGAGFFPLVAGIVLAGLCVLIGAELFGSRRRGEAVALGHRDVVVAVAAMGAVPFVFENLGAYLSLGLFSAALLFFVGRIPLSRAVPAAARGMVGVWYFFKIVLGLQLPNGPFL